jgi:hypothetical protein
MEVIFYAILLGLIPAYIGQTKGENFFLWWLYGSILFIIALIHSLLLKPNEFASDSFLQNYSEVEDKDAIEKIETDLLNKYPNDRYTQKVKYEEDIADYFYMKNVLNKELKNKLVEDYPNNYKTQRILYNKQVQTENSLEPKIEQKNLTIEKKLNEANILKQYRSYIIFTLVSILLIFITLPFHYVPQRFMAFPKDNFTFSNTLILQSDIDNSLKRYNEASIIEKMTIINDPLFKKLKEKELIYFLDQQNYEPISSHKSSSETTFNTLEKDAISSGNYRVATLKVNESKPKEIMKKVISTNISKITKSPFQHIGKVVKLRGNVMMVQELPPDDNRVGAWAEVLLLADNPNSPYGTTTIDYFYKGDINKIDANTELTIFGYFTGTYYSKNAFGVDVEGIVVVGNHCSD